MSVPMCFATKETEAQWGHVSCPQSHSGTVLGSLDAKAGAQASTSKLLRRSSPYTTLTRGPGSSCSEALGD
jgi:hypothetical protein